MTDPLSLWKAIVLGIVEGVTEFLPVSSTGHLLIAERLLGVGQSEQSRIAADSYIVAIQLGAILAVLGIYRERFVTMIDGVRGRSEGGRNVLIALIVAFLPAAIIGFVAGDAIKEYLLEPWPVAGAFFVGGVAILIVGRLGWSHPERVRFESVTDITPPVALVIGVTQALALWPGTSRSLVTILAALAIGVSLRAAVEFAFLLGFVTLGAASAYELFKNGSTIIDTFGWFTPLVGAVVAGVSAWISVKAMISWLENRSLDVFGYYRIGAAGVVAVLVLTNVI